PAEPGPALPGGQQRQHHHRVLGALGRLSASPTRRADETRPAGDTRPAGPRGSPGARIAGAPDPPAAPSGSCRRRFRRTSGVPYGQEPPATPVPETGVRVMIGVLRPIQASRFPIPGDRLSPTLGRSPCPQASDSLSSRRPPPWF